MKHATWVEQILTVFRNNRVKLVRHIVGFNKTEIRYSTTAFSLRMKKILFFFNIFGDKNSIKIFFQKKKHFFILATIKIEQKKLEFVHKFNKKKFALFKIQHKHTCKSVVLD